MDPIIESIVKNDIPKKTVNIKTKNGASIYSMNKLTGGLAIIAFILLFSIRLSLQLNNLSLSSLLIPVIIILGLICLPLFLYQVVSKVFVYADKIVYRNAAGVKKSLLWREVKTAYIASGRGGLRLVGGDKALKIRPIFNGFYYIVQTASEKCPKAFDLVSALERDGNYKEFRAENGTVIFGKRRLILITGLLLLLIAAASVFFITNTALCVLIVILCGPLGIYMLLSFIFSRVFIDAEGITARSFIGKETTLQWSGVMSARIPAYSDESNIVLESGGEKIKLGRGFSGFNAMAYIIAKRCKKALK